MTRYECTHLLREIDPTWLFSVFSPVPRFTERLVTWVGRRVVLPPHDDRKRPDHYAGVAQWNLDLPGACIGWDRYALSCVSLRDIKGAKPAIKHFAKATHEFALYAVNPDTTADEWACGLFDPLTPVNYCVQCEVRFEHAADWICECIAEALVAGHFVVESGGVRGASEHFRGNVREWERQAARIFDARG